MAATNLDAYDLSQINLDGVINEDVMQSIFDISNVPMPFTDRAGSSSHDNQYFSWRMDKLQDPVITGQRIDGQETATGTTNETKSGRRVGQHSEIRTKRVEVSTRAQEVDTIAYANELAYQLSRRQIELRRDVEATLLSNNGSIAGTDAVAGQQAGIQAWITTADVDGNAAATGNANRGATGADGGWDATAGDSLVAPHTPGTTRALSEVMIRDVSESIYQNGGEADTLMTSVALKRKISEYLFTDAARIATMTNESPGGAARQRKAQGSVDLYISDYSALMLVPNRLMGPAFTAADNHCALILDFNYVSVSYLQGYQTKPLAKTGLSDNRQIEVDYGLRCTNWDAFGGVFDIDPAQAMVAG